ncbi:glycosyltransferase [Bradyrhizobium sp. CSA112]|uniref:glycosyltransferase n=1 Tax=Bradyrhizobium sp. CSA112 TaxID=2699170 RepID=UPI0023AE6E79|nr:glycosyltransferase [Bradyrhizobium sp. CSA112]MDE5453010.1 glycosyltransferase [Bradyrhizobium sp. CSA112]
MIGLFILNSDLDALKAKGVAGMIGERTERGYLSRVITLHPMAKETRVVDAGPELPVHELALPAFEGARVRRWLGFIAHVFWAAIYARRLALRESASFVRAQDPYFSGLIGFLATRWPRVPFCISIHADYDQRHALDGKQGAPKILGSRNLAKRLERFLLRRADLVMPIRESLRIQAIGHGASSERTVVFPHAVDFQSIDKVDPALPHEVKVRAVGRKVLLFTGRLSRENYVWDVVEVARRIVGRGDCIFVFIGLGPELDAVRSACSADEALRGTVIVCGPLERRAVHAAQKAAYAGLVLMGGFTLIEFCAARRPCVAYDVEWHRDLIEDGKTGMLLREGDREGLYKVLSRLLDEPDFAGQLGQAAYTRARAQHDVESVMTIRRNIYQRLTAERTLL